MKFDITKEKKNAVFVGNFLRPNPINGRLEHSVDIKWLYFLISPALHTLEISTKIIVPSPQQIEEFYTNWSYAYSYRDYPKVHALQNVDSNQDTFLKLIGAESNSFVIGFELPPVICHILDCLKIDYVNFVIHPIRFLNDLSLTITHTTNIGIKALIEKFKISQREIETQTSWLNSKLCRSPFPSELLETNTAIFIDQKPFDTALIKNGEYIFPEHEFLMLLKKYGSEKKFIYKAHPYIEEERRNKIVQMLDIIPNATYTEKNIYELMHHAAAGTEIFGFSSSVLHEAPFFGLRSIFLNDQNSNGPKPIPIGVSPIGIGFWECFFDKSNLSNPSSTSQSKPSLRETLGISWGWK
jgi:hypothetical protein